MIFPLEPLPFCWDIVFNNIELTWEMLVKFQISAGDVAMLKGPAIWNGFLWVKYFPIAHCWTLVYVTCSFSFFHIIGKVEKGKCFRQVNKYHGTFLGVVKYNKSDSWSKAMLCWNSSHGGWWWRTLVLSCPQPKWSAEYLVVLPLMCRSKATMLMESWEAVLSSFGFEITLLLGIDILSLFRSNSESYQGHLECFPVSS